MVDGEGARVGQACAVGGRHRRHVGGLRDQPSAAIYDFKGFSYTSASSHSFVEDAERFVGLFTRELGLDEAETRKLLLDVRGRFVMDLKVLLSHGATREKFAPFRDLVALGAADLDAHHALLQHADYQRWLFEEAPVLQVEPFSLAQVYVDSECGTLTWEEIDPSKPRSGHKPVSEQHGGRRPYWKPCWS